MIPTSPSRSIERFFLFFTLVPAALVTVDAAHRHGLLEGGPRIPVIAGPPALVAPATVARLDPEPIELLPPSQPDPADVASPCAGVYPTDTDARAVWCRMTWLAAEGRYDRALLRLRELRGLMPRLADRLSLLEGDYRMAAAENGSLPLDVEACGAYESAIASPLRAVAARARVGRVRCLLTLGEPSAEQAYDDLVLRYRRLPQRLELQLLLARSRESRGDDAGATSVYRAIDLNHPGSRIAHEARQRLAAMSERGVDVGELSVPQRIVRLQRLARTGPLDMAREEVRELRELRLVRGSAARVAAIGARIARREGRFEDAAELLAEAHRLGGGRDRAAAHEQRQALATAMESSDAERARAAVRRLIGNGPAARQPLGRLLNALQIAVRGGATDQVDRILQGLAVRRSLTPWLAFNAAITAAGTGDDALVAALFERAARHAALELPATYHRARALERLGRLGDARQAYLRVLELDRGSTPFYAFWARQRLPRVERALVERCRPERAGQSITEGDLAGACPAPEPRSYRLEATAPAIPNASGPELAERLQPLIEAHGEAYPWLARAADLLTLDLRDDAADELHEASLAWSDARGRRSIRTGVESLYRGTYPPRHWAGPRTRRARLELDSEDLEDLSQIASAIGDHGLAVRFGGWHRANERPRAHEDAVLRAARRHGVDPNLLLAVMRVESVYNRRIISYAGAVGLMQIMPATAHFIARQQGDDDFDMNDMFDPEVNIDFAAWYLASLIERFDGRLPLAIAAYNGGPHNVRLWLRQHGRDMSLEAFLETIPFGQTHRYVRRVLTHYEAYRAQQGLGVPPLDTTLPEVTTDRVAF